MSLWPRKHVIVPVDFSDDSMGALNQAAQMVDDQAHLRVVHVLEDFSPEDPSLPWTMQSRMKDGEKKLNEWLPAEFKSIQAIVLVGNPGDQITDYAKETQADLIVLPSHGRTGLKRLVLGSVAERVVRLAHCPVLVLRK